jgi:hypothetical protein
VGFALVGFLPPFVELSSEIRQYPFLLCFVMASAYVLELALEEDSVGKMSAFFVFLYLGMLTHFSAILFAGAVGIYSLWRLFSGGSSRSVVTLWITGQAGALGLFGFLYRTHIAALKDSPADRHMQAMLSNSYFHPGHGHVIPFVFARSFGIFQYTFGQLAVGDIAGVLFVAAIALLISGDRFSSGKMQTQDVKTPSPRELGLYLVLPFVINCVAAIAGLYPYGGTRHSAFLVPFAVAGVSSAMVKISRQKLPYTVGSAILTIAICQLFGAPHRPYIHREDQRLVNMTQAIGAIRQQASPADTIFVDFQTNFLLRFYLCPEAGYGVFTAPFKDYPCGGYRVISTSPETTILTADIFARRWNDMVSAYNLKPSQAVWIFQAGWDISLARDLQEKIPELHDLKAQSFGRNISLFRLTTDHTGTAPSAVRTRYVAHLPDGF